jgi:hypothetical protein
MLGQFNTSNMICEFAQECCKICPKNSNYHATKTDYKECSNTDKHLKKIDEKISACAMEEIQLCTNCFKN